MIPTTLTWMKRLVIRDRRDDHNDTSDMATSRRSAERCFTANGK